MRRCRRVRAEPEPGVRRVASTHAPRTPSRKHAALVISLICALVGVPGEGEAQVRCGQATPSKLEVERTTASLDTERFMDVIQTAMDGKFKGYAVIFTGSAGRRLGFRRAGWAVDPCENDSRGEAFDLDTETALGSTEVQARTSHAFNVGLYDHVFRPLGISASCDPREPRSPPGRSQYFPFHNVARSYDWAGGAWGRLLPDNTLNCAANSPAANVNTIGTLIAAYNAARR